MSGNDQHREKMAYYMPLTKGSPYDGPSPCVFSQPKMNYSEDTQKLIKNFMDESRLTFSQKSGFQSILRDGKSLPKKSSGFMQHLKAQYYSEKHAAKVRQMGVQVKKKADPWKESSNSIEMLANGGKRSYKSIKAMTETKPPVEIQTRRYLPVDKEAEKARLAHKMAFTKGVAKGTNNIIAMSTAVKANPEPSCKKFDKQRESEDTESNLNDRVSEIISEIHDRADFLESMKSMKRDRSYRSNIVSQIQTLIKEMRKLAPKETVDSILEAMHLESIDASLVETNVQQRKARAQNNILAYED